MAPMMYPSLGGSGYDYILRSELEPTTREGSGDIGVSTPTIKVAENIQ